MALRVLSTWDHALLTCNTCSMNRDAAPPTYAGYRFPVEIIGHAVWLYFRFALSYRDVEELLAERGVIVTYETIRRWSRKFGQAYANGLRRRRPRPGDKWHLDEVLSASTACSTTSGGLWTRRVASSISWCSPAAMLPPRGSSSADCSRGCGTCHGC